MAARVGLARARKEPRLDPVRWRRPGAGLLIRLAVMALLLGVAAVVAWSGPKDSGPRSMSPCHPPAPQPLQPASSPGPTTGAPASPPTADGHDPTPVAADGRGPALVVPPGNVGVPVRLADPTALALVRPGDRVDLLRVDDAGHGTTPVAASALVLGITGADDPVAGGLLVALRPTDAEKAVVAQGRGFAILIRPS